MAYRRGLLTYKDIFKFNKYEQPPQPMAAVLSRDPQILWFKHLFTILKVQANGLGIAKCDIHVAISKHREL